MSNTSAQVVDLMYRIHSKHHQTLEVQIEEAEAVLNGIRKPFDLIKIQGNQYHLLLDNISYNAELLHLDRRNKRVELLLNGEHFTMQLEDDFDLLLERMGIERNAGEKVSEVLAPMPGLVLDVLVKPGQSIQEGDPLLVLEAMKMENVIKSPCSAVIETIPVNVHDKIDKDQLLIQFAV